MKPIRTTTAAVLLALSAAAGATTGPLDLSSGSTGFSNTPVAGAFADVYTFSLLSAVTFDLSLTSVRSGAQDVDFTSISLVGPGGTFSGTQLLPDPVELWSLSAVITPGQYVLTINGINSVAVGSYGGNAAVSAVPEPGTVAMFLAGLGFVGAVARRAKG